MVANTSQFRHSPNVSTFGQRAASNACSAPVKCRRCAKSFNISAYVSDVDRLSAISGILPIDLAAADEERSLVRCYRLLKAGSKETPVSQDSYRRARIAGNRLTESRGSKSMAISQKEEARALNADEHELVEKSHHPALQELPDNELSNLVKLIRERRQKANAQADRHRREMRGKADPKGATPSKADEGSKLKVAVLAMAMRRLNNETERRRRMAASTSLVENAQKALAMKQASEQGSAFNSRHAHEGMRNKASRLRQNLIRPMELGRQRKAASVAQAKRDGR